MKTRQLLTSILLASTVSAGAAEAPVAAFESPAPPSTLAAEEAKKQAPVEKFNQRAKVEAEAREFVKNHKTTLDTQLEQYK